MWPCLAAVRALGGSAHINEMYTAVIESAEITTEQQSVMHGDGMTELQYRLAWARTYLKNIGLVVNSARAVWSLTELGETISEVQMLARFSEYETDRARAKTLGRLTSGTDQTQELDLNVDQTWHERILDELLRLSPSGFERLSQRLLREAGFINVQVKGRSGDGGIDGVGLYRPSLISFPVYFQCKKYRGTVGPGAVRDFRGAMAGRGEKGLLITTGSFTKEAIAEANRDGAPPVELINGSELADLMRTYQLGVRVTRREIEDVEIDPSFFDEFRN